MDSNTIIAVASIVTAGLTIGIGCMCPALGGRQGSCHSFNVPGTAARRFADDHPDLVRRFSHDRVPGHLTASSYR